VKNISGHYRYYFQRGQFNRHNLNQVKRIIKLSAFAQIKKYVIIY
jgi:hypothetical protein